MSENTQPDQGPTEAESREAIDELHANDVTDLEGTEGITEADEDRLNSAEGPVL